MATSKIVMLSMTLSSVVAFEPSCNSPQVGSCTFFGCNSDHGPTDCVRDPNGGTSWGQPIMICVCAPDSEKPCTTASDQYHCVAKPKPQACTVGHKAEVRNAGDKVWLTGVVTKEDPCEVKPDGWSESFTFKEVRKAPDTYKVGDAVAVWIGGSQMTGKVKAVDPVMILPDTWESAFPTDHFEDVRPKDWEAQQKAASANLKQSEQELADAASHADEAYRGALKTKAADQATETAAEKAVDEAKKEQKDAEDTQAKLQKVWEEKDGLSKKAAAAASDAKDMAAAADKAAQNKQTEMETANGVLVNKTQVSATANKALADAKESLANAKKQLSDAESAANEMENKIKDAEKSGQKVLAQALETGYKSAALPAVKTAKDLVADRTTAVGKAQGQADAATQAMDDARNVLAQKTAAYKDSAVVAQALGKTYDVAQAKANAAAQAASEASKELADAKKTTQEKQAATKAADINLTKAEEHMKNQESQVESAKAALDKATAEHKNEDGVKLQDLLPWNVGGTAQLATHLPTHNNLVSLLACMTITGLVVASMTALKPLWRSWFVTGDVRERLLPQ